MNLPIGLQLLGRPFEEAVILNAGYALEQQTDYHKKLAPIVQNGA